MPTEHQQENQTGNLRIDIGQDVATKFGGQPGASQAAYPVSREAALKRLPSSWLEKLKVSTKKRLKKGFIRLTPRPSRRTALACFQIDLFCIIFCKIDDKLLLFLPMFRRAGG